MFEIHKKIMTDENNRPVAVQIEYQDWLEIERQLGMHQTRPEAVSPLSPSWSEILKQFPPIKIRGGSISEDIVRDRRERI